MGSRVEYRQSWWFYQITRHRVNVCVQENGNPQKCVGAKIVSSTRKTISDGSHGLNSPVRVNYDWGQGIWQRHQKYVKLANQLGRVFENSWKVEASRHWRVVRKVAKKAHQRIVIKKVIRSQSPSTSNNYFARLKYKERTRILFLLLLSLIFTLTVVNIADIKLNQVGIVYKKSVDLFFVRSYL